MSSDDITPFLARAHALGLRAQELDDLVHDAASLDASARVNAAEEDLDSAHGRAEAHASGINNAGIEAQLSYLSARLGPGELMRALDALRV